MASSLAVSDAIRLQKLSEATQAIPGALGFEMPRATRLQLTSVTNCVETGG